MLNETSNTVQEIEISRIDIEMAYSKTNLKKRTAEESLHNLNYRVSAYDIAFAMSITDEII